MISEERQRIGDTIRKARKEKKITQTQLGEFLGLVGKAKTTVSDYERGKIKIIPFEKRIRIAKFLNMNFTELLYENELRVLEFLK